MKIVCPDWNDVERVWLPCPKALWKKGRDLEGRKMIYTRSNESMMITLNQSPPKKELKSAPEENSEATLLKFFRDAFTFEAPVARSFWLLLFAGNNEVLQSPCANAWHKKRKDDETTTNGAWAQGTQTGRLLFLDSP
jgi:hypothetical protein